MRTIYQGTGESTVIVDQDMAILLRRLVDSSMPGAFDAMERELNGVWTNAVTKAPVRTGKFKSSIQQQVILSPDASLLRGRLWSDVEYAKFIRSNVLPNSGSALVELFRKPMKAAGAALVIELGPVIAERMRRG